MSMGMAVAGFFTELGEAIHEARQKKKEPSQVARRELRTPERKGFVALPPGLLLFLIIGISAAAIFLPLPTAAVLAVIIVWQIVKFVRRGVQRLKEYTLKQRLSDQLPFLVPALLGTVVVSGVNIYHYDEDVGTVIAEGVGYFFVTIILINVVFFFLKKRFGRNGSS